MAESDVEVPSTGRPRLARMLGGVVDQGLWGLSNISLVVVAAKRSGLEDVGVMGLVVLLYVLLLGATRALTGMALIVRFSAGDETARREAGGAALRSSALLGVAGAAVFLAVGLIAGGRIRGPMLAVGALFPPLMMQDVIRHYWLAERRPWQAARVDLLWLVISLIGYPIAIVEGLGTAGMALAWAAGGALSGLVDVTVLRLPLRRRDGVRFATAHWDLSRYQLIEAVLQYGSAVFAVSLLGLVSDLEAVGQVRLGQSLLSPLRTLLLGVAMAAVPDAVHMALAGPRVLRRHIRWVSVGLGGLAALSGIAIQLLPDRLGTVMLGTNWDAAKAIAIPLSIGFVGIAISFGPMVGLRSIGRAALIVRCSFVQVVLGTIGFVWGAVVGGAGGAAGGQAVGLLLATVVWWRGWSGAAMPTTTDGTDDAHEALAIEELGTVAGE